MKEGIKAACVLAAAILLHGCSSLGFAAELPKLQRLPALQRDESPAEGVIQVAWAEPALPVLSGYTIVVGDTPGPSACPNGQCPAAPQVPPATITYSSPVVRYAAPTVGYYATALPAAETAYATAYATTYTATTQTFAASAPRKVGFVRRLFQRLLGRR